MKTQHKSKSLSEWLFYLSSSALQTTYSTNMEKTAIDWLFIQLYEKFEMKGNGKEMNDIFLQAKEMEKEQIIDAFDTGTTDKDRIGEEYYNDIYSHPDPSDDEIFNNFNHEGGIRYENNTQN